MITNKKTHDSCSVAVEWLDPSKSMHYAKLVCVDTNCCNKKKFVQWLGLDDAIVLTEDMKILQLNDPIHMQMISLEEGGFL